MYKAIVNANIVTMNGIFFDSILIVKGSRIFDIIKERNGIPVEAEVIDAAGAYVGPGFVDIHVHGGNGYFTYDENAGSAAHFLKHGTTSFLATPCYTQSFDEMLAAVESAKLAMKKSHVIKGIYMEGPYTNSAYGANAGINYWQHGIAEREYKALVDACGADVKVWTIAPELEGIRDFCAYAKKVNPDAMIAMGHSEATQDQISALGKYRPGLMTHTMNATGTIAVPKGIRGYGPDEYCFTNSQMYAELISDSCGIHVDPSLQRMLLQIKGVERVVLVTDATVEEAPSPQQFSHITDLNFDEHGDLNGSLLTMDMVCRNIMTHTNCGIAQAFIMASLNPAKVIGLDHDIGSIEKGKIADLVFVDDKFNVLKVMTEGELYE